MLRNQKHLYDMSTYISFATVIFTSKSEGEKDLSSVTVYIGPTSGCTASHAFEFLYKNPLIKANLRDSNILSVTFSYSEL